ncbi:MAG: hypothetical protein HY535_02960 [Chloroflexi bacterium]|nr:hypothetical protein [Chloroflexota bacterium]
MPEKYQREIEEILRKVAELQPARPRPRRPGVFGGVSRQARRPFAALRRTLSPGRLLLASVALVLVAIVLRARVPDTAGVVAWAAIVIFVVGYALFFVAPPQRYQKRWRGRPIASATPGWWQRLRRWLGLR